MTGWLAFLAVALTTFGVAILVGRAGRPAAMLVAAALFAAAAGYAWQGAPAIPGAPYRDPGGSALRRDTLFAVERTRLLSPYGESGQWLTLADGLDRAGQDQAAVSALVRPIERRPRDVALRLGYAHALLVLADYNYTPAVALAYQRAAAIDPADPAPPYFAALAKFEGGDLGGAERGWRALDAALPPGSPWHKVLAEKLRLFDMLRAGM